MAHVSIGPILGTTQWRAKRDSTSHDCATEGEARAMAKALATGGLQIVETPFAAPLKKARAKVEEPTEEPDLTGLSIRKLEAALETGDHDAHLEAIDMAERAGRNRVGALEAIQARVDAIAGE